MEIVCKARILKHGSQKPHKINIHCVRHNQMKGFFNVVSWKLRTSKIRIRYDYKQNEFVCNG